MELSNNKPMIYGKVCEVATMCGMRGSDMCGSKCWKGRQAWFQLKASGIPRKYLPKHLDYRKINYSNVLNSPEGMLALQQANPGKDLSEILGYQQYADNIIENLQAGKGFYIYGYKSGTGKTTHAINLLLRYLGSMPRTVASFERPLILFVSVPRYFEMAIESFNKPNPEFDKLEREIRRAHLVVFDDVGVENGKNEWVRRSLYTLIDGRDNDMLPMIFTSNLSITDMYTQVGDRIARRIEDHAAGNFLNLEHRHATM